MEVDSTSYKETIRSDCFIEDEIDESRGSLGLRSNGAKTVGYNGSTSHDVTPKGICK
jgi:hypothetical protein